MSVGPLTITVPSTSPVVKSGGSSVVSGIALADPSLPSTDDVTLTLGVTSGTLNVSTTVNGGVLSSQVTTNGTGSVTITASLAAINATLADANGLTYTPTGSFNGTDTLSLTGGDTLGNNGTGQVSVTVVGPPTITAPTTQQVLKAGSVFGINNVALADPSLPTADTVTLTLTSTSGNISLSTSVTGGVASSGVTGNNSKSVTVTGTLAEVNATLAATNGLT